MKCHVNLEGFEKNLSGKRKVWTTDGMPTYCCCFTPAYFIWEKDTQYNDYEGYSGYVDTKYVELLS